ncbi:dipeptide ABC transporter ATP-binding protein [Goodfellowiella coeruleoviolacea]|uniref:Peptide/nickel transport system ATP-binding protein n=1 Tax=Goodfellowiella coeruleoviolacea TaxID=334858 RepID=A0AAE3G8G8_9PSEU|nr:ABC transporter ATP-binding protein [Goodfellowiella coeruleoviolacea]MCP2163607.1 peptide/nickel transport system ATP-binding protein [Goodfellowiella coeruleoviolacea]
MSSPRLSVENLSVEFSTDGAWHPAVRQVSYQLDAGQVLAVVGESGSGKTVTALSLLGLLPATARVTGRALLDGTDLLGLDAAELRAVRGNRVGMVFQEPMSALNPVFTIGDQLVEAIRVHRDSSRAQARQRALDLLRLVDLPDPEQRLRAYPHELSGGQLQRVVIAMAMANEPAVLIADEPTTALDVTVQAEILALLRDLRDRLGVAILLITHDMGVVADIADHVVVMRDGRVVEQGPVAAIFTEAHQDYTKQLLGSVVSLTASATAQPVPEPDPGAEIVARDGHVAVAAHPAHRSIPDSAAVNPALLLDNLSVSYGGRFRSLVVRAVDRVSLHVEPGEVLGLVGESGSGKSTIAAAVTGLVTPSGGQVQVAGVDITRLGRRAARTARGRIGVVFQDPASALNPRATIASSVAEPLRLHRVLAGAALERRVDELLDAVHLSTSLRNRFPHELSGGQRQRVCIARAVALNPDLLIADEPTSALDVSVQAKILDLFADLQRELSFACLFISHDLAVIQQVADRVAVMHRGHLVEQGPTRAVLTAPLHPYTRRLLAAAPVADLAEQRRRRQAWQELNAAGHRG